jgi:hypothetical protein
MRNQLAKTGSAPKDATDLYRILRHDRQCVTSLSLQVDLPRALSA